MLIRSRCPRQIERVYMFNLKNKSKDLINSISNFQMMAGSKDIVFTDFLKHYRLDEAEIVGGGHVIIKPGFGVSSRLFIIKPYSIVSSTDPRDGWGGWRHSFGHHRFACCAEEGKLDSVPIFTDFGIPPIQFVESANKLGCFLNPKNFSSVKDHNRFLKLLTSNYPSRLLNNDLIVLKIDNLYTVIASNERGSIWLEENLQYEQRCDLTEHEVLVIKLMYI